MSLSRSPSPVPGGGWSSPGLNYNSGRSSPTIPASASPNPAPWETVKMRNLGVNGYPSFSTHNQGFFTRHMRRISSSLPRFASHSTPSSDKHRHAQRGKDGWLANLPGAHTPFVRRIQSIYSRTSKETKRRLLLLLLLILGIILFYNSPLVTLWRRSSWGGDGKKFVIILGANVGGGVMEWKGAREWAIERDSVRNKRKYVGIWGYDLEIVDMSTKKRYAHEWRESWEKVDFLRSTMRKYPEAEWFWWLDLNTFVMEPWVSLQDHVFSHLEDSVYRDINQYNPLNITHPPMDAYLDEESRSASGDGQVGSLNLLLSQDCVGFNLGSFFLRRSAWTDQLLDLWWDPVAYEQKHMEWDHKEQDALEQLYESHPWIRKHTGFLPQRQINSFPPGACSSENGDNITSIHYNEHDRDFVVNMAGCEWGRDCWGEMYHYRQFSYWLNRNPWERFKEDFVAVIWFHLTGQRVIL